MYKARFDYSSTHVEPPTDLAQDITAWSREYVSDDDIYVSYKDFTYGREDEIHITVLYGLHCEKSDQLRLILMGEKPVQVTLGEVKVFSNPFKFDVLVIEAFSDDLVRLNKKIAEQLVFTNKYGVYHPHVTIAYVKKGKGWKHNGLGRWKGYKFTSNYVVFSSKNGTKERIVIE